MKIVRTNTLNDKGDMTSNIRSVESDLSKLFLLAQGRIRFGRGTSLDFGENIQGQFVQFTTSATPNAENTIAHTIGAIPTGRIILWQDKAGSLFQGPTTGTAWTSSSVYMKCDIASVTFKIFLTQ